MSKRTTPTQVCASGIYWLVEEGDTLYLIGRKLHVSVEKLLLANPGIDPHNLQIGTKICIPL